MNLHRFVKFSWLILSCFIICGFTKPVKKQKHGKQKVMAIEKQQQKPLNLTVPSIKTPMELGNTNLQIVRDDSDAFQHVDLMQSKNAPLEMKGQVIMSQEPELEKSKTADGAGIVINIRH